MTPAPKPCDECGEDKNPSDGLVRIYGSPRAEGSRRSVCPSCIPDVVPWLFSYLEDVDVRCAFCGAAIEHFLRTPTGINFYCTNCVDLETNDALDYLVASLETTLQVNER